MKSQFIRRKKDKNFTQLPNEFLRDENLSFNAIGMLSYLHSYPDDWDINLQWLLNQRKGREGKTVITRLLKELSDNGYLLKFQSRGKNGFGRYVYIFDELPSFKGMSESEISNIAKDYKVDVVTENVVAENVVARNVVAQNQRQTNTVLPNTVLPNTVLREEYQDFANAKTLSSNNSQNLDTTLATDKTENISIADKHLLNSDLDTDSNQDKEGTGIKEKRKSCAKKKKESATADGIQFAQDFNNNLVESFRQKLDKAKLNTWGLEYDKLLKDHSKAEIYEVMRFALKDKKEGKWKGWYQAVRSPTKFNDKKDGVTYFNIIKEQKPNGKTDSRFETFAGGFFGAASDSNQLGDGKDIHSENKRRELE